MRETVIPARNFDWVALRQAFITRPERATYAELSAEFRIPEERIKRAACDEGWASLRAAHLEDQLKQGDAAVAILRAAKMDSAVMGTFTNLAIETVRKLQEIVDQVESKKSVNTRANTLNTVSFAMGNIARALKEVGVVGIPKALKESAGVDSGNGRWNPQMLQALNVTVQNIVAAGDGPRCDLSGGCPSESWLREMGVQMKHPTQEDSEGHACQCPDHPA